MALPARDLSALSIFIPVQRLWSCDSLRRLCDGFMLTKPSNVTRCKVVKWSVNKLLSTVFCALLCASGKSVSTGKKSSCNIVGVPNNLWRNFIIKRQV